MKKIAYPCFCVVLALALVWVTENGLDFFCPVRGQNVSFEDDGQEIIAVFLSFPEGEIILNRNIGSFRGLSPEDIALIPVPESNADISAKFVGFFKKSSMGFGYNVLTPIKEGEEVL